MNQITHPAYAKASTFAKAAADRLANTPLLVAGDFSNFKFPVSVFICVHLMFYVEGITGLTKYSCIII